MRFHGKFDNQKCRRCAVTIQTSQPHLCLQQDVIRHQLNLARDDVLEYGTPGERMFYRRRLVKFRKRKTG